MEQGCILILLRKEDELKQTTSMPTYSPSDDCKLDPVFTRQRNACNVSTLLMFFIQDPGPVIFFHAKDKYWNLVIT